LEVESVPGLEQCVEIPLAAGSAVIHHSRTLHSAGVNTSPEPRRAYILGFAVQTRRHSLFSRDYPWNLEKRTAREQRSLQTLPPWKRTLRKLRRLIRGG
jgi:ectoine hydroxylase-related dioxygenase (phytanoyl-CoA dioxygenase family)